MKTLADIYAEDTTRDAAGVLAAYHAQPPERIQTPIQTVRSFMSDELLMTPIKAVRDAAATPPNVRYGLAEFVDGLQNALTFNGLNDKVYALATQLVPALATVITDPNGVPILTQSQADTILGFVRRPVPPATLADAERVIRDHARKVAVAARQDAVNEYDGKLAAWVEAGGTMPAWGAGE